MSNPAARPETVRALLFGSDRRPDTERAVGRLLNERGGTPAVSFNGRALAASAAHAVDVEIAGVLHGLLGIGLGDVLMSCWRKHRSLVEAGQRTLAAPGSEEIVALASHRVTATYRPHVDLLFDGTLAKTFHFELTLRLDVTGVAAVVCLGELVAIRGGDCEATGTLTLDGAPVAEGRGHFDPQVVVPLDRPVPLVDRAAA